MQEVDFVDISPQPLTQYGLQRLVVSAVVGRSTILVLALGLASACPPAVAAAHSDAATVALRAALREHLKHHEFSLDRQPGYLVTDLAIIEPALDAALRYADRRLPMTERAPMLARASAVTPTKKPSPHRTACAHWHHSSAEALRARS